MCDWGALGVLLHLVPCVRVVCGRGREGLAYQSSTLAGNGWHGRAFVCEQRGLDEARKLTTSYTKLVKRGMASLNKDATSGETSLGTRRVRDVVFRWNHGL